MLKRNFMEEKLLKKFSGKTIDDILENLKDFGIPSIQIRSFEKNLFIGMKNVKSLNFSDNKINCLKNAFR